jgi:hypothetical protein
VTNVKLVPSAMYDSGEIRDLFPEAVHPLGVIGIIQAKSAPIYKYFTFAHDSRPIEYVPLVKSIAAMLMRFIGQPMNRGNARTIRTNESEDVAMIHRQPLIFSVRTNNRRQSLFKHP